MENELLRDFLFFERKANGVQYQIHRLQGCSLVVHNAFRYKSRILQVQALFDDKEISVTHLLLGLSVWKSLFSRFSYL